MGTLVFQATLGGSVNLIGPNIAGTVNFTLPSADGTSGQAISTNGSGVLSFGTLAVTAGGTGVTTSTGSGNNVLSTSPTLVTPLLGTPTSGVATNLTGLPLTTGVTGVLPTANGGTNLSSFTSGGVVYASSASVLATGSALTFDGSKLLVSGSAASAYTNPFELKNTDGTGYLVSYMTVGSAQAAIRYAPTLFFKIGPDSGDTTTPLVFAVNNSTEVGRFTPAGNFGIGTSSPSARLHISGTTDATQRIIVNGTGNVSSYKLNYNGSEVAFIQNYQNSEFAIGTAVSAWMGFNTNNTERARIDSSGNFLVGTTSTTNGSLINWYKASGTIETSLGGTTSAQNHIVFANPNGNVGSIQVAASLTTYNATSDYRLKNVIGAVSNSGERIDALEPIEYTWKVDGLQTRGFLAHKFQEVYPNSVNGEKDAVDDEGNPVHQTMQASTAEVIADLVAEIQSLRKRLADAGIA